MKLEKRSGTLEFNNENEVIVTLDLRQSKRFHNEEFETESIDGDLFVRSIKPDAPILYNHHSEAIVSDDYEVTANNGIVTVKVQLDPRNMYANTILSLREKSQKRLGASFAFRCLSEEIRNKHREVKDLIVSEISILSVASAYPSSVRCLESNEIREISLEELQEMIDKSVAKALEPKEKEVKIEPEIAPEPQKIEEKQPQIEQKPLEIKLNTDDFKGIFSDFLSDLKAELTPKNDPKIEEKEVKVEEKEVKIDQKVEEKPVVEAPQPQKIDDETLQKVEQYKKMLAEMEE